MYIQSPLDKPRSSAFACAAYSPQPSTTWPYSPLTTVQSIFHVNTINFCLPWSVAASTPPSKGQILQFFWLCFNPTKREGISPNRMWIWKSNILYWLTVNPSDTPLGPIVVVITDLWLFIVQPLTPYYASSITKYEASTEYKIWNINLAANKCLNRVSKAVTIKYTNPNI